MKDSTRFELRVARYAVRVAGYGVRVTGYNNLVAVVVPAEAVIQAKLSAFSSCGLYLNAYSDIRPLSSFPRKREPS
mgnify:CR=1 FL=1